MEEKLEKEANNEIAKISEKVKPVDEWKAEENENESEIVDEYGEIQAEDMVGDEDGSFSVSEYTNVSAYGEGISDSVLSFSYKEEKEAKKLLKLYEEAKDSYPSKFVEIKEERKSTFDNSMIYKQTLENSDYIYYGRLKDGLPDGKGLIIQYVSNYGCYLPYILGNFEKGQLEGYAIVFSEYWFHISSEAFYKNGKKDGNYTGYTDVVLSQEINGLELMDQYESFLYKKQYEDEGLMFLDMPLIPVYTSMDGEYRQDKEVGKWMLYGFHGNVLAEKRIDGNGSTGKAIFYYPDGMKQYEGEIKDGKYHGKGTLYNEDGSIKYKGKFKNGSIDN